MKKLIIISSIACLTIFASVFLACNKNPNLTTATSSVKKTRALDKKSINLADDLPELPAQYTVTQDYTISDNNGNSALVRVAAINAEKLNEFATTDRFKLTVYTDEPFETISETIGNTIEDTDARNSENVVVMIVSVNIDANMTSFTILNSGAKRNRSGGGDATYWMPKNMHYGMICTTGGQNQNVFTTINQKWYKTKCKTIFCSDISILNTALAGWGCTNANTTYKYLWVKVTADNLNYNVSYKAGQWDTWILY